MKKFSKKNKGKKDVEKAEKDSMIEHLEDEIKTDMHKIKWFKKEISEAKENIAQNRKILEKLTKLK